MLAFYRRRSKQLREEKAERTERREKKNVPIEFQNSEERRGTVPYIGGIMLVPSRRPLRTKARKSRKRRESGEMGLLNSGWDKKNQTRTEMV